MMGESSAEKVGSIFLDKINLSNMVIRMEAMCNIYMSEYLTKIRGGTIKKGEEMQFEIFNRTWDNLNMLYGFLKYNKIKNQEKSNEVKVKKLRGIMDKYILLEKLDHSDLVKAYDLITEMVSLAGYHDDLKQVDVVDDAPQYW